jgi:tubulin polyglutamylase TTLL6/13
LFAPRLIIDNRKYVGKPLLIDGYKFDLRVYVLVTCMDPLRIFIYKDGLARFATEPYDAPSTKNMETLFMHLTNYAINKTSEKFDPTEKGSKRSMESVFEILRTRFGVDTAKLWAEIGDVVVKTLLVVQPQISRILDVCFRKSSLKRQMGSRGSSSDPGSQCFEILGFDILLDKALKPWVLEVNHSPSVSLFCVPVLCQA